MRRSYGTTKYGKYTIEGCGDHYEMYCKDGMIGSFSSFAQAKRYVDREKGKADELWNMAVIEDNNPIL